MERTGRVWILAKQVVGPKVTGAEVVLMGMPGLGYLA